MQAKKRYLLASICCLALLLFLWYENRQTTVHGLLDYGPHMQRRSFQDDEEFKYEQDLHLSARQRRETFKDMPKIKDSQNCRMESCFDFSKCRTSFKVYVYPSEEKVTSKYNEMLTTLRESPYYTNDPDKACIFVLAIDTLDRDVLSKESYVANIQSKVNNLQSWNGGTNHIVFNLYTGTWPNYSENDFGFDLGKAILAKASFTEAFYRPGFDISFPLFHKELAFKGGQPGLLTANNVPPHKEHLLVFKGKRYLTGIGSETRNSLYHIHNNRDIILLTTCKHGKGWNKSQDERCKGDNQEYEKWDYKVLMHNATFCLVPRGRRLGSYRFLEALQAACIPVLLSNGWVLPFSEVIDWKTAAVLADERLLLQVPSIVRSVSQTDILSLRQKTQFLWDAYFSSVEKMVATTLEIIKERVHSHMARTAFVWNSVPGALSVLPEYSDSLTAYPFYLRTFGVWVNPAKFTALIYATSQSVITPSSSLYKLVKTIVKSQYLEKVLILWNSEAPLPTDVRWPVPANVPILLKAIQTINARFESHVEIQTNAILSLDEDAVLTTDEIDFAFSVWQHFPDRIVGYPARAHYWEDTHGRWGYTSKWTNHYSIVLTGAAFIHKYYTYLYTHYVPAQSRQLVQQYQNCEDILLNFLVSHLTKFPPIKVTQRKQYREAAGGEGEKPVSSDFSSVEHFKQRHLCLNTFSQQFGYMPLRRSNMRLDPLLFKDPVSISRKRYRQIELVNS